MSYDLLFRFESALDPRDFLGYFADRSHFKVTGLQAAYENTSTGVCFHIMGRSEEGQAGGPVTGADFNINFFRPSFFGLEAAIELTAFIRRFQPQIQDPQADGMGQGPYSEEGFLRGWNAGNRLGARALAAASGAPWVLPASTLQRAWKWNYERQNRIAATGGFQFVPTLFPLRAYGRVGMALVWPQGMPALLPVVDFVLVGGSRDGKPTIALVSWAEVIEVLQGEGMDGTGDPVDVQYVDLETPEKIVKWIAGLPELDRSQACALPYDKVIDSELLATSL